MPKSPIARYLLIEAVLFGVSIVVALLLNIPAAFVLLGVGLLVIALPYFEGNARVPESEIYSVYQEFAKVEIDDYKDRFDRRNAIALFPYLVRLGLPLVLVSVVLMMIPS